MKNFKILLLFLSLGIISLSACEKGENIECWVEVDGDFELIEVSKDAEFIEQDGKALNELILEFLNYPAEARENGIEGLVKVQFEITESGIVRNRTIIQDIGGGCGEALLIALESITQGICYHPAEIDGVPVTVRKELQVRFKLEG